MTRHNRFVGRADATSKIVALLRGDDRPPGRLRICSVEGPAGIGKSTLWEHCLGKVDLAALKYLHLRVNAGTGQRDVTAFGLVADLVRSADAPVVKKHAAGHFFPRTARVLDQVRQVQAQARAEFAGAVPGDEEAVETFVKFLGAAMGLGKAANDLLPWTRSLLDCSEGTRRAIEDAVREMGSLRPAVRWLPALLPDVFGVERLNEVKQNALGVLADALVGDLAAVLCRYRAVDRWLPTFGKQPGIDKLLLVIDDYERLAGALGEFVARHLVPQLARAEFPTLAVVLGRDQLTNTDTDWDQYADRYLQEPVRLDPLPRSDLEELARSFGCASRDELDRLWTDTLGYPFYVQLWVEEARGGGRTAAMLRRFYERVTKWMDDAQKGWLEVVLFLDRVDLQTLSWFLPRPEEARRVYGWFEKEASIRDTTTPVFRVREYLRTRLIDYLRLRDPVRCAEAERVVRERSARPTP